MTPGIVISIIAGYFLLLLLIARFTSVRATTEVFFTAKRQSPWFVVAFGMIGASLSGVTFISVPGEVGNSGFEYFQLVLGYLLGYLVIGGILMPMYYRLNLVSIYTYLDQRFGFWSYKSGAFFFLLSRTIGAAFRLFLVAGVLQMAIFDAWGVPFYITVLITIVLIWVYTFRGGIKTIVYTDTLQTFFMLSAVAVSIIIIMKSLGFGFLDLPKVISESNYAGIFEWEWRAPRNFFKQFFAGAFITIVMTGLDQDMMQKNLTCRNIGEAQKNMFWFSIILVIANLMFLSLGALLFIYSAEHNIAIPERTDDLFPFLAINEFSSFAGILFILGITAAAYSSADSALTSLTTSFCVDFLNFKDQEESYKKKTRIEVHVGFSVLIFIVIVIFKIINDESVINSLFLAAGYTYGPLLGLYAFGMFTKLPVKDKWVPLICVLSPVLSFIININSEDLFWGYKFGFEILILNGLLTFIGLLVASKKAQKT
jgi:SSS family transporter